MWLFRAKDKTHYVKLTAPTTADGKLEVGTLWSDTTANLLKRCTSISPITFVSVESGAGGAPVGSTYVIIGPADATLTDERILTAGAGISITDAGAGSTVTIAATGAVAATAIGRTFLLMGA